MNEAGARDVVTELGRELVASVAPQELPLFRAISEDYFKRPEKVLGDQKGKDELLGFGYGEAIAYATPVVLAVTASVVKFLSEEVKKSLREEGASVVKETVKRLFRKFRPAGSAEPAGSAHASIIVTPAQAGEVRRLALERARQLRLPEADAARLADLLVQSLHTD